MKTLLKWLLKQAKRWRSDRRVRRSLAQQRARLDDLQGRQNRQATEVRRILKEIKASQEASAEVREKLEAIQNAVSDLDEERNELREKIRIYEHVTIPGLSEACDLSNQSLLKHKSLEVRAQLPTDQKEVI